jgi:hypothetical protein
MFIVDKARLLGRRTRFRGTLRVFPEYGGECLWAPGGAMYPASLGLSRELQTDLEWWYRDWLTNNRGLSEEVFEAEGHRLVERIQAEVGDRWHVVLDL